MEHELTEEELESILGKFQIRTAFPSGKGTGTAIVLSGLIKEGQQYICWKDNQGRIVLKETKHKHLWQNNDGEIEQLPIWVDREGNPIDKK